MTRQKKQVLSLMQVMVKLALEAVIPILETGNNGAHPGTSWRDLLAYILCTKFVHAQCSM